MCGRAASAALIAGVRSPGTAVGWVCSAARSVGLTCRRRRGWRPHRRRRRPQERPAAQLPPLTADVSPLTSPNRPLPAHCASEPPRQSYTRKRTRRSLFKSPVRKQPGQQRHSACLCDTCCLTSVQIGKKPRVTLAPIALQPRLPAARGPLSMAVLDLLAERAPRTHLNRIEASVGIRTPMASTSS